MFWGAQLAWVCGVLALVVRRAALVFLYREVLGAPIDVVEAQTQVANFRQTVSSAQHALTEA